MDCNCGESAVSAVWTIIWYIPAKMQSILGLATPERNITQGASYPVKPTLLMPLPRLTTSVAARGRRFRSLLLPPLLSLPPPQGDPSVGRPSGELLEPAHLCRCPESTRHSEQRLHLVRPLLRLLTLLQLLLPLLLLLLLPQGSGSEVPE